MRTKKLYIDINSRGESVISKFIGSPSKNLDYGSEDIELLRKIFSNEKSKILFALKKKKPKSIYEISKILKRDFKSVYRDLLILERFGFIEFHAEKKGNRESMRPILLLDEIQLIVRI